MGLCDDSTTMVVDHFLTQGVLVTTLDVQDMVVQEFLVKHGRISGYMKDPAACSGRGWAPSIRNGLQIFGRQDGCHFQKNTNPIIVEICVSTTIYNTDSAVILSKRIQKQAHTNG
jgi:hypothetical protein